MPDKIIKIEIDSIIKNLGTYKMFGAVQSDSELDDLILKVKNTECLSYYNEIYLNLLGREYVDFERFVEILNSKKLIDFFKSINPDEVKDGLAVTIVVHALTEEYLNFILDASKFLLQLRVFPDEINFKRSRKNSSIIKCVEQLEESLYFFDSLEEVVALGKSINKDRNNMAHEWLQKSDSEVNNMVFNIIINFAKLTNLTFEFLGYLDASQPDLINDFVEQYTDVLNELIEMGE